MNKKNDFKIEIIYSDSKDAELRLFKAFELLLNKKDILNSQYLENE